MSNLLAFLSSFTSYLLLSLIIVVLGGIGIFIGITLRKRKDGKLATKALEDNGDKK